MRISDEQRLENLDQRIQEVKTEIATRLAKMNDQRRRVRKRLSARDRKRETQCLIVRGRFYDHVIKRLVSNPPDCPAASPQFRAWLDAAFDAFVTRADHRALFGLPPLAKSSTASSAPAAETSAPLASPKNPIPGWHPFKPGDGSWRARLDGDTSKIPDKLVGCRIVASPASGESWIATVLEAVQRSDRHVLVRCTDPPKS